MNMICSKDFNEFVRVLIKTFVNEYGSELGFLLSVIAIIIAQWTSIP